MMCLCVGSSMENYSVSVELKQAGVGEVTTKQKATPNCQFRQLIIYGKHTRSTISLFIMYAMPAHELRN